MFDYTHIFSHRFEPTDDREFGFGASAFFSEVVASPGGGVIVGGMVSEGDLELAGTLIDVPEFEYASAFLISFDDGGTIRAVAEPLAPAYPLPGDDVRLDLVGDELISGANVYARRDTLTR